MVEWEKNDRFSQTGEAPAAHYVRALRSLPATFLVVTKYPISSNLGERG